MLTATHNHRHTESLSKPLAVIPPRQIAAFFMPEMGYYPSLVGVETRHTTPARENRNAASKGPRVRPTARIVGSLSLKFNGGIMPNPTISAPERTLTFNAVNLNVYQHNGKNGEQNSAADSGK